MCARTTILIADDHPVFRFGLRALLGTDPDLDVLAEATTGSEAIRLTSEFQPDLILMDLNLPEITGIAATAHIRESHPAVRILVLTMHEDHDSIRAALVAGASGYLVKGATSDEILRTIHTVAAGQAVLGSAIAEVIHPLLAAKPAESGYPFPDLTIREREILAHLIEGATNAEIADTLYLSPKTVRNHMSSIFAKLDVEHRAEAIVKASRKLAETEESRSQQETVRPRSAN